MRDAPAPGKRPKDNDRRIERPPAAIQIREPSGYDHERRQRHHEGGDDPLRLAHGGAKPRLNIGNGSIDDGKIDAADEAGDADAGQTDPARPSIPIRLTPRLNCFHTSSHFYGDNTNLFVKCVWY